MSKYDTYFYLLVAATIASLIGGVAMLAIGIANDQPGTAGGSAGPLSTCVAAGFGAQYMDKRRKEEASSLV